MFCILKAFNILDVWVIDQVCSVKMARYWPSSFFACLWTETKSRSINTQIKTRPISSHLDRTNLVNKGIIILNMAFGEILLAGYSG